MRTKIALLLMSVLTMLFIVACSPGAEFEFTQAIYATIDEQIALPSETTTNLTLEDSLVISELDFNVTWSSNNTAVISNSGIVTRPTFETGNVSVIMTATITMVDNEETTVDRPYTVVVIALPQVTFTVTFNSNGGSAVANVTAGQGTTISAPTAPTRAGYTFDGWYKEASLTTPWNFATDTVTAQTTLYAKWVAIVTYTVTFDPNNGSNTFTQTITQGGFATAPTAPVKPGYQFTNWQTTVGTVWNFTTNAVNANLTLIAQYDIITYTITYVIPEEAELSMTGITSFNVNTLVDDLGSAYLENHEFLGWFTEATGGTQVTGYPVGTVGNKTLYAQFEEDEKFTVTFNDNNGNLNDVELYYGYVDEPDDPIRVGYEFAGWYKDVEFTMLYDFEFDIVSEDITLYAKWDVITYSITYDTNFGMHDTTKTTYTVNTPTFDLDPAIKDGYLFLGWFTEAMAGVEIDEIQLGSTGNLMLYARFEAITYTITFDANGGTVDPLSINYTIETPTFSLPLPVKENYFFDGWLSDLDEHIYSDIEIGSMFNATFTAVWVEIIEINFYDYMEVDASYYESIYFDGMFTEYVIYEDELYGRGDNGFGQLANGSNMPIDQWIHMTPFFGLAPDEYIVQFKLNAPTFIVVTSQNRILVWGFMGYDMELEPIFEFSPVDLTTSFELDNEDVIYIAHLFFTILVQTSDHRIISLKDGIITDITPVLNELEFIEFVPVFGGGELTDSNVIFTGERIFMFPILGGNEFIDMTSYFPLEETEEILAISTQGIGIHMITTDYYRFAQLPENEEDPVIQISLTIDLSLNEGEVILDTFGGGGFVTSEKRIFLPVYIIDNEEDEFPSMVKFVDVTSELGLEIGEEIEATFNPVFILTTFGRLLLLMPDESFTTDPMAMPFFELYEIDTTSLEENEFIISASFANGNPIILSNLGAYSLEMTMEGMFLDKIQLSVTGLIYTGFYPLNQLDLFEPVDDRPYEAFDMWYEDEERTIPFNPETAYNGMSLFAQWVPTHYLITFEMGFEEEPLDPIYVEMDMIPVEPMVYDKEHYVLSGWYYYDSEYNYYTYDFTTALNQHVTLYPIWVNVQYDVEFVFDLVESTEIVKASSFMELQYLSFDVPQGYEVIGIYLDEAMTIPADMEQEVLSNLTLYVMLEPITFDIYYYQDNEEIVFDQIFMAGTSNYGVTNDGRIFAWGYNSNGSLGIGFADLYFVNTPFEVTDLFNLGVGETVINIYGENGSTKVLVTSEGRVFMWGYPDTDDQYYQTPQDITMTLDLSITDEIVYANPSWSNTLFITLEGDLIFFEYYNEARTTFGTGNTFSDVLFASNFGPNKWIVIEKDAIRVHALDHNLMQATLDMDYTSLLNGGMIVGSAFDYETYSYEFYYTDQGDIIRFSEWMYVVESHGSINLNPGELITNVFDDFGTLYFLTSDDRLLYKSLSESGAVDLSVLVIGEFIIGYHQGNFITNMGAGYVVNMAYELEFTSTYFDVSHPTEIVGLIVIEYFAYGITSDGDIVKPYQPGAPLLSFTIGTNLIIEQTTFGEIYEYLVPDERVGYVFEGWYTGADFMFIVFEEPYSDMILYAKWTALE